MNDMYKMWLLFDPRRALVLAAVGVCAIALVIHFAILSSPRYCEHLGWCSPTVNAQPGAVAVRPPAR